MSTNPPLPLKTPDSMHTHYRIAYGAKLRVGVGPLYGAQWSKLDA